MEKTIFNADRLAGLRPGVVACIINKKNKILLGHKAEYGIWELPQGGIEEDEDLINSLEREIKEELGEKFFLSLTIPEKPLITTDQVIFPSQIKTVKKIKVNNKEISMLGKKYYFCVVAKTGGGEPDRKEYQDFQWVDYKKGLEIFSQIQQRGKKRILENVFNILKDNGFIS